MNNNQPLLTIGGIAKMLGITRRIIINYENHGLITADTRGEFNTGYRYYSMDTLVRIRTIRSYQKFGLSLEEIKGYLDNSANLESAIKRLEALRDELNLNIEHLHIRMAKNEHGKISTNILPAQTVYSITAKDTTIAERTNHLREIAYKAITSHGTDTSKRMYFTEQTLGDADTITYCAVVPNNSKGEFIVKLPQIKAITKYHHGSYDKLHITRNELINYAQQNSINLTGRYRNIYLEGPPQHKKSENFITLIALEIE